MKALKLFSSTLWGLIPLWQVSQAQSFSYQLIPVADDVYHMDILADSSLTEVSSLEIEITCNGCTFSSQTGTALTMDERSWFDTSGNWDGSFSINSAGDVLTVHLQRTDGGLASGDGYIVSLSQIVITIDDFSKRFPLLEVRWKAPVRNDIRWEIYNRQVMVFASSPIQKVEILSMDGKVLQEGQEAMMPIDLLPGVYLIRITHPQGMLVDWMGIR